MPFVVLYAKVSEDGYLFGATDDPRGESDRYWPEEFRDEGTVVLSVPPDMVQALTEQGLPGQVYSDGYEAWQDVLKRGCFREL